MAGKDYSEEAHQISKRFDELSISSKEQWQDEQANRFGYTHLEPIRHALSEMQLPIEQIVDIVDTKLQEIRNIANGK